jgi:hypothetical protein
MEQNNSTRRVTPYELATLASRIDPERCASDPAGALAAAQRVLHEAKIALECAHAEEGRKDWEREEAQMERVQWVVAVKEITGQNRRDRAEARFLKFLKDHEQGQWRQYLDGYKRDGFIPPEMQAWQELFMNWSKQPKRKKGKQGRRISEHDARLRTQLVGLVPRKPRKRA